MAAEPGIDLKVFYLWDFGVTDQHDPGFGRAIRWDLPLLEGYASENLGLRWAVLFWTP